MKFAGQWLAFCGDCVTVFEKKDKKNGERDGTRTRNIHRDRVAL